MRMPGEWTGFKAGKKAAPAKAVRPWQRPGCGIQPGVQLHPFAQGMCYYKLFWIFFIGCFLGVVVETIWCLLTRHTLESRAGLLYGPFNPVYGFGAVVMTLLLYGQARKRDVWIFMLSAVIGGVFEYFCSYFQEMVMGTVSWQYTHSDLGIASGRTSIIYCVFWGGLGLLWVRLLFPYMTRVIERIPGRIGIPLTWALTAFMVVNMGVSAMAVCRQTERRAGEPAESRVERFLDQHYPDEYLAEVYPNMVAVK